MAKIIDGKALAEKIKDEVVAEIVKLKNQRPNLAIILVGDREDSKLYVDMKEQEAKKVGIDTHLYKCPHNIPESELCEIIEHLNQDELIDAILLQLPLPEGYDTDAIIKTIDKNKDVDRFHPENLAALLAESEPSSLMPPVFAVVFEMLKSIKMELAGQKISIVANSDIFGVSLARLLEAQGAITETVRSDDSALGNKTKLADILITAVGRPGLIKEAMVKKDAVVIDIGISKDKDKTRGDVDYASVNKVAGYITPVPGGVGPMTIAMLFKNTLALYQAKH